MLVGLLAVVAAGVGVFVYLWLDGGAHPLPTSVAIERFRQEAGSERNGGWGPTPGVYVYRGSGTAHLSLPPKTQSVGPTIPGTVTRRADRCFELRLDFSDAHWQRWTYCLRSAGLVSPRRAGYYRWDFVAFSADDTSTYTCRQAVVLVPTQPVTGRTVPESCTGTNDNLDTGPVSMRGTTSVLRTTTVRVGNHDVPAAEVRETVTFSGGQHGSNHADTWFSLATGLPLEGTWNTKVVTPSSFGTTTLTTKGTFSLVSTSPRG